jgi:FlaA1/EpsC-like NDP-sugar epimerase
MDMKKALLIIMVAVLSLPVFSQKSAIDDLFDRYNGKEGFTTVYISSKMFSLLSRIDSEDEEFQNLVNRIKSIRILSIDSARNVTHINFATELVPRLSRTGFEDLMTVKELNDEVRFMVREVGDRIAELVMITGGAGSSVVCITGNLDLKTISSLSENLVIGGLEGLEKVEK